MTETLHIQTTLTLEECIRFGRLIDNWDKVKCTNCGKEISLLDAKFSYEMPVCRNGCNNG